MMASIEDFLPTLDSTAQDTDYPYAQRKNLNVPVYQGTELRHLNETDKTAIQEEWVRLWMHGPGVLVIEGFYEELAVVQSMTSLFLAIIFEEEKSKHPVGDHFGKANANQRLWNALEKAAVADPESFIDYYQNPILSWVAEAWLGPGYQLTAQVNLIRPGCESQSPHRDYHLGFQTDAAVAKFPLHAQSMSAQLTLQGAIAHVDMPIASGPTRFLPFSQIYPLGYQLFRNPEFVALFDQKAIQLPLAEGDAIFFNPALMHAAGANHTKDCERMANLLQISSPFGRPMEFIDHERIQLACYEPLSRRRLDGERLDTLTTIMSDSYPFPTNLDRDVPTGSLTPTCGKDIFLLALKEKWGQEKLQQALADYRWRRGSRPS